MPDYFAIEFEFDAESLRAFAETGNKIVIAKHRGDDTGSVAWLAWEPCGADTVTWRETYGLFAADAALRDGEALQIRCALAAAWDRAIYPFTGKAFGTPEPARRIPAHHYDVRNDSEHAMAFGLLQSAVVNGSVRRSVLNAVVVPDSFTADFAALTTVSVWMQPGVASGTIIRPPPAATVLSPDAANGVIRCRYDPATTRFTVSTTHRPEGTIS